LKEKLKKKIVDVPQKKNAFGRVIDNEGRVIQNEGRVMLQISGNVFVPHVAVLVQKLKE
jgi:hypothetical protein